MGIFTITRRVPDSASILTLRIEAESVGEAKRTADEVQYAAGRIAGTVDGGSAEPWAETAARRAMIAAGWNGMRRVWRPAGGAGSAGGVGNGVVEAVGELPTVIGHWRTD